jgi:hypothetical protein
MAKKDRQDGDELPQRQGFFPTKRRAGEADGWEDPKRDPSKDPQPSTEHVAKHAREGYPVGKRNP